MVANENYEDSMRYTPVLVQYIGKCQGQLEDDLMPLEVKKFDMTIKAEIARINQCKQVDKELLDLRIACLDKRISAIKKFQKIVLYAAVVFLISVFTMSAIWVFRDPKLLEAPKNNGAVEMPAPPNDSTKQPSRRTVIFRQLPIPAAMRNHAYANLLVQPATKAGTARFMCST